jgi:uncharacterized protein with PhoU and TrkA domain
MQIWYIAESIRNLLMIRKNTVKLLINLALSLMLLPSGMAHVVSEEYTETAMERIINLTEIQVSPSQAAEIKSTTKTSQTESDLDIGSRPVHPHPTSRSRLFLLYHSLMFYE